MNSVAMIDVGESFERALQHVLNNTLGQSHTDVMAFIANHVLRTKPWMLVTTAGIEEAVHNVMGVAVLQDFVLELTFTFGAYWGASTEKYAQLASVLSTAVAVQTEGALPKDIKDRTVPPQQAEQRLVANRWLMVLVLMSLFTEPAMVDGKKITIEVAQGGNS